MDKIVVPKSRCEVVNGVLAGFLRQGEVVSEQPLQAVLEKPRNWVVERLTHKILERAERGNVTYGCTLAEQKMSPMQALIEAEEELTDALAYLGKYLHGITVNEDKVARVNAICQGITHLTVQLSTIIFEVENGYHP